jgi:hypothetical protein
MLNSSSYSSNVFYVTKTHEAHRITTPRIETSMEPWHFW